MKRASKTRATVRDLFREGFNDPDFMVWFEDERAKSEIALRIVKARKAAGLTQAELAIRVDTAQRVIARLSPGAGRDDASIEDPNFSHRCSQKLSGEFACEQSRWARFA